MVKTFKESSRALPNPADFDGIVDNTNLFILDDTFDDSLELSSAGYTGVLDLPFKNTAFEFSGATGEGQRVGFSNTVVIYFSIICHEVCAGEYIFYIFAYDPDEGVRVICSRKDDDHDFYLAQVYLVKGLLEALNKYKAGALQVPKFFTSKKIGSKKKNKHEIKDVFVLTRAASAKPTTYQGHKIDWSHRWEVRGHWRKVKGLGKDREGVYGVRGFTWIKAHVKGNADKPLVKKTRVVK